jgi:arylsulfatase A-like enzyme
VVVILSDHGEELWDRHQLFGAHGHSLYSEMLDVPFLVHGPATAGRGLSSLETPVSTVDLPPTAAALLGLTWDGPADGVDLAPLLTGGTVTREVPILADLQREGMHPEIAPQACIVEGGLKYIEPMADGRPLRHGPLSDLVPPVGPSLYRLADDPKELENLAAAEPDLAKRMGERLRQALALALSPDDLMPGPDGATDPPPGNEPEGQLKVLGYLD